MTTQVNTAKQLTPAEMTTMAMCVQCSFFQYTMLGFYLVNLVHCTLLKLGTRLDQLLPGFSFTVFVFL